MTARFHRLYLLLTVLLLLQTRLPLVAQLSRPPLPPPPSAASLGKFGDIPVSLYTGIPSIEIPLYTIKTKSHTIPISLSYHASGVKVDEEASSVGLGWALNAGGVITRSVRDADDLGESGNFGYATASHSNIPPWKTDGSNQYDPSGRTQQQLQQDMDYFCGSGQDIQPDVFYYNFQGYSGKFFVEKPNVVRVQSKADNLLIESVSVMQSGVQKAGWRITTPNGYRYVFGEREGIKARSESETRLDHMPAYQTCCTTISSTSELSYTGSWFLSSITAPDGEVVTFEYDRQSSYKTFDIRTQSRRQIITIKNDNNCSDAIDNNPAVTFTRSHQRTEVAPVLRSINYRTGQVVFSAISRTDMDAGSPFGGPKKFEAMVVYEGTGSTTRFVKGVSFITSYFDNPENQNGTANKAYQRLRLDGVQEYGAGEKPAYRFTYNYNSASVATSLPRKDSYAKDHYGLFNGAFTNDQKGEPGQGCGMPYLRESLDMGTGTPYVFETVPGATADRDYHAPYSLIGCLTEIKYPTGGTTSFRYEPNTYYESAAKPVVIGPGIRIASITSTSEAGSVPQTKRYVYTDDAGNSTGKRMSREEYHNIELWTFNCSRLWVLNRYAFNTAPQGTAAQGQPIGYSFVKQLEGENGENGKTEFYYSNTSEIPATAPYIPGTPNGIPPDNGLLKRQIIYKCVAQKTASFPAAFKKLKETIYSYATSELYSVKGTILRPNSCPGTNNEFIIHNLISASGLIAYPLRDIVKYYDNYTYWQRKSETTEITYDQYNTNKFISVTTSYAYGNAQHRQPTQITTILNDGKILKEYRTYPSDYSSVSTTLTAMAGTLRLLTQPVETFSTVTNPGGTENVVRGTYIRYALTGPGNGMAVPIQQDQLSIGTPVALGNFQRSAPGLTPDGRYQPTQYISYESATGNMRSSRKVQDVLISYQWGYTGQLPVATFQNADRTPPSASNLALGNEASFLGFESGIKAANGSEEDYWSNLDVAVNAGDFSSDAHTGRLAWRMEPATNGPNWGPTRSFQPTKQQSRYRLSAWVKTYPGYSSGAGQLTLSVNNAVGQSMSCADCYKGTPILNTNGEWRYVEVILDLNAVHVQTGTPVNTAPSSQLRIVGYTYNTGSVGYVIDDIRFQPVEAATTTYTYNPESRQPTSISDPRSYPTYYDFDGLQRLQAIKDHRGGIQQHFEYHYQK